MFIVDDGSVDGTRDKIESYKDERILLIKAPHIGIEKLRDNYGHALEKANSPLLAILDGDDFWPANKLELEVPAFDNENMVMAYGHADIYDIEGRYVQTIKLPNFASGLVDGNTLIKKILACGFFTYSVTTMFRRSAIDKIGGFVQPPGLPLVDTPTWMTMLCGARCVGIPEVLGCYRVHDSSVCRTLSSKVAFGQMEFNEKFLDVNWHLMALSVSEYERLRREISAFNNHRRGAILAGEGHWSGAYNHFCRAAKDGNIIRKIKAFGRLGLIPVQSKYLRNKS